MSKARFTPGPWVAGEDGWHRAWIADLHNGMAVWTKRRFKEVEAYQWGDRSGDAHLIAAAPELYNWVKLLERSLEFEIREDKDQEGQRFKTATLNRVRATLTKVHGCES